MGRRARCRFEFLTTLKLTDARPFSVNSVHVGTSEVSREKNEDKIIIEHCLTSTMSEDMNEFEPPVQPMQEESPSPMGVDTSGDEPPPRLMITKMVGKKSLV
jgi:hypothetical protein